MGGLHGLHLLGTMAVGPTGQPAGPVAARMGHATRPSCTNGPYARPRWAIANRVARGSPAPITPSRQVPLSWSRPSRRPQLRALSLFRFLFGLSSFVRAGRHVPSPRASPRVLAERSILRVPTTHGLRAIAIATLVVIGGLCAAAYPASASTDVPKTGARLARIASTSAETSTPSGHGSEQVRLLRSCSTPTQGRRP